MNSVNTSTLYFYSLKDVSLNFFLPPFLANSDVEAKRFIRDSIEPNSQLARYPADYHLYRLGVCTSDDGIVGNVKECICSVTDIIRDFTGGVDNCE